MQNLEITDLRDATSIRSIISRAFDIMRHRDKGATYNALYTDWQISCSEGRRIVCFGGEEKRLFSPWENNCVTFFRTKY